MAELMATVKILDLPEARDELARLLARGDKAECRVRELETEVVRLNREMEAYRQKLTPDDARAMRAVIDALYVEKHSQSDAGPRQVVLGDLYAGMLNLVSLRHERPGCFANDAAGDA